MKRSISLPKEIDDEIINRLVELRKETPEKEWTYSGVLSEHLEAAIKLPLCEVIKT